MRLERPFHLSDQMLLAGDVGGTKTLLGLFSTDAPRPAPIDVRTYPTHAFRSVIDMLNAFERDTARPLAPQAVGLGVAGPIRGRWARLTNVAWTIDADEIAERLQTRHVALLNDLEAMATAVPLLRDEELEALQVGTAAEQGHAVLIAAGTGLGQAYLHRVNGSLRAAASEGGHADFAARSDRELELVRELRGRFGRAEVEQVLSGPGLVNLHRFTHRGAGCPVVEDAHADDAPARISQGAITGRCQFCVEALRMFVEAYGAEAGNLALRGVASAGVYIGGGIAPKILPALRDGAFMRAFLSKEPMRTLLERMPVHVVLNSDAGLVGAAVKAREIQSL
jgi:glucokinase